MAKFLSENMTLLPGSRGFVDIPANGIEDVESTPHAQAYAELCQALLKKNKSPLTCLHCEQAIREKANSIVEIDDNELEHLVGIIHNDCCRPIDRVTGTIKSWFSEKYDFLKNFDGITWSSKKVNLSLTTLDYLPKVTIMHGIQNIKITKKDFIVSN